MQTQPFCEAMPGFAASRCGLPEAPLKDVLLESIKPHALYGMRACHVDSLTLCDGHASASAGAPVQQVNACGDFSGVWVDKRFPLFGSYVAFLKRFNKASHNGYVPHRLSRCIYSLGEHPICRRNTTEK